MSTQSSRFPTASEIGASPQRSSFWAMISSDMGGFLVGQRGAGDGGQDDGADLEGREALAEIGNHHREDGGEGGVEAGEGGDDGRVAPAVGGEEDQRPDADAAAP